MYVVSMDKGDLFKKAPMRGAILTHACNAKGVWGRGIAVGFKKNYPEAFKQYNKACKEDVAKVGTAFIADDPKGLVGCLITSDHYSPPDPMLKVMHQTKSAVVDFLRQVEEKYPDHEIHSNLFNSGLFEVPWEVTKNALEEAMVEAKFNGVWKVWEYNP